MLQNRTVAREALKTALVEAEGILNSRPITHVSNDAGDIEALTSNHFLLLPANPSYEEADGNERDQLSETILYFRIPHNTLCLPPKFCINHCF